MEAYRSGGLDVGQLFERGQDQTPRGTYQNQLITTEKYKTEIEPSGKRIYTNTHKTEWKTSYSNDGKCVAVLIAIIVALFVIIFLIPLKQN